MKIAYITTAEILGSSVSGGIQCSKRNLSLLKQAFGDANIYVCAITGNKDFLAKAEENIAVFYSSKSKLGQMMNVLFGRRWFGKKTESAVIRYILQLDCDVVFIEISLNGSLQKRLPDSLKQILFVQNVERVHCITRARKDPLYFLLVPAIMRNELKAVKNADIIITLNNRDSLLLQKYYNRNADMIIPITFDDSINPPKDKVLTNTHSPLKLLFIGHLYNLNEHGVIWFINEVMPNVNAELTVVGRNFEKRRSKLQRSNVNIIGTVDDLSQYYYNADAVVIPLLEGGGMKVKTAEALMYGKPMFATDEALEGYDVEGLLNVFVCNTADEYIEAINTYAEKPLCSPFDENIRALFLEKYHTPGYVPVLRALLKKD